MTSLRQRMIEDMQVRNLSVHTQTSYVQQVSLFARQACGSGGSIKLRRAVLGITRRNPPALVHTTILVISTTARQVLYLPVTRQFSFRVPLVPDMPPRVWCQIYANTARLSRGRIMETIHIRT